MLEEEMATFSDVPLPLLSYQLNGFESYYGILRESEESLAGLSRQRRSERTRICDLLADVFVAVGAEVFLLCVFAVPITALAAITPKSCIRSLQTWWNATTSRPRALKLAVEQICKPLCIGALVSSLRKRKILKVESGSGMMHAQFVARFPADDGRTMLTSDVGHRCAVLWRRSNRSRCGGAGARKPS